MGKEGLRVARPRLIALAAVLASLAIPTHPSALAKDADSNRKTKCEMNFTLSGWSVFYKTGKGEGEISCDNGQSAKVSLKTRGGGLTFGKSTIYDGKGVFSEVTDIRELFGSYATAEAHAGAGKSGSAQAMTKGEVSLALSGTGGGVDIGFSFGKFTIRKK